MVKQRKSSDKISLKELLEKHPTGSSRDKPTLKAAKFNKWKDSMTLGTHGAASGVRIIDPATLDLSKYLGK